LPSREPLIRATPPQVREAFTDLLLRKIQDPAMDLSSSAIVQALVRVFSSGESATPTV